jgi:hypothetical protein
MLTNSLSVKMLTNSLSVKILQNYIGRQDANKIKIQVTENEDVLSWLITCNDVFITCVAAAWCAERMANCRERQANFLGKFYNLLMCSTLCFDWKLNLFAR